METGVPEPSVGKAEQSNTSILFGDKFILKLFRRIDLGVNPDLEVGRFLTEKGFPNIAAVAGALEYFRPNGDQATLGSHERLCPGLARRLEFTLDTLTRYFERANITGGGQQSNPLAGGPLSELTDQKISTEVATFVGSFLESARLLGRRTGELHLTLASDRDNKDFAPEPFTPFYQRSLYQSMRNLAVQNLQLLRRRMAAVPEQFRPTAEKVISQKMNCSSGCAMFTNCASAPNASGATAITIWARSSTRAKTSSSWTLKANRRVPWVNAGSSVRPCVTSRE